MSQWRGFGCHLCITVVPPRGREAPRGREITSCHCCACSPRPSIGQAVERELLICCGRNVLHSPQLCCAPSSLGGCRWRHRSGPFLALELPPGDSPQPRDTVTSPWVSSASFPLTLFMLISVVSLIIAPLECAGIPTSATHHVPEDSQFHSYEKMELGA